MSRVFALCYKVFTRDERDAVCLISGGQGKGKAKVRLCCVTLVTLLPKYIKSHNKAEIRAWANTALRCTPNRAEWRSSPCDTAPHPRHSAVTQ